MRARSRDRAGDAGVHAPGVVTADASAPVVDDVRIVRAPGAVHPVAELAFRAGAAQAAGTGGPRPGR